MLIIDRNDWQTHPVPDVASQRFEVGDHQVDLPFRNQVLQPGDALCRLAHCHQVLGDGAFVAHTVVHVGKTKAKDFSDLKVVREVAQSPVERSDVERVPLIPQMIENFLGARGMAGAFAVHAVKDIGHRSRQYKAGS